MGISVLFMTIDLLGGVFSDLSLAFKTKFDVIAGVTYSLVVVSRAIHSYHWDSILTAISCLRSMVTFSYLMAWSLYLPSF